jgi:hypothetical protein
VISLCPLPSGTLITSKTSLSALTVDSAGAGGAVAGGSVRCNHGAGGGDGACGAGAGAGAVRQSNAVTLSQYALTSGCIASWVIPPLTLPSSPTVPV